MERFEKILEHHCYQTEYKKISEKEKNRKYCRHDLDHFLACARLVYIFVLEHHLDISRDVVYAAALLHDLGRGNTQRDLVHENESARLAEIILPDCGYHPDEIQLIHNAILSHRTKDANRTLFETLFYQGDKWSRNCLECTARQECYWSEEAKNHPVI